MTHVRDITIEELSEYKYIGVNNHAGLIEKNDAGGHILISSEEQSHIIILMVNYTDREKAEVTIFKNGESYANYMHALYKRDKNESLGYVYSFLVYKNKIAMVE